MDLHIRDVFKKLVKQEQKFGDEYYTERLSRVWQDSFNSSITSRTSDIKFSKGKLTICVNSSSLKHDLFINRDKIVAKLNSILGEDVVQIVHLT